MYDVHIERKQNKHNVSSLSYDLCSERRENLRREVSARENFTFDRRNVERRLDRRPLEDFPFLPY